MATKLGQELTDIAQYAADRGPFAADRPAYNCSAHGFAFQVGLWARDHGIAVYEVVAGRGYNYRLNNRYNLNFKDKAPVVTAITMTH